MCLQSSGANDSVTLWVLVLERNVCALNLLQHKRGHCQCCHKTKLRGKGEENDSEQEGESSELVSQIMVLENVGSLLDYIGQRMLECSDFAAAGF